MTVDYSLLRTLTARQLDRALRADGFVIERQRGSHRRYIHSDGRGVTLSFHRSSDTFAFKTLRSMIEEQANWTERDLKRLNLIS